MNYRFLPHSFSIIEYAENIHPEELRSSLTTFLEILPNLLFLSDLFSESDVLLQSLEPLLHAYLLTPQPLPFYLLDWVVTPLTQ